MPQLSTLGAPHGSTPTLFGVGLVGSALLALSVLPLATAYSVCEFVGSEAAVDDAAREAPVFYGTYIVTIAVSAAIVLAPGAPLVEILVATQVANAVLLLPLLVLMHLLSTDRRLLGEHRPGGPARAAQVGVIALVTVCVAALAVASVA